MADAVRDDMGLTLPIGPAVAFGVLDRLGIQWVVLPPDTPAAPFDPTTLKRGLNGLHLGELSTGRWAVYVNEHTAKTRQVQTVFHELYEILRRYFHLRGGGQFPEGMLPSHYPPEHYARWFAAAVVLPKAVAMSFWTRHGLNIELLRAEVQCSRSMALRRIRDTLGNNTPFVGILFSVRRRTPGHGRCLDLVAGRHFRIALNRHGARRFPLPKKGETWDIGPLARAALDTGRIVATSLVHAHDLLGLNDATAVACPILYDSHPPQVAVYVVPRDMASLLADFRQAFDPLVLDASPTLLGPRVTRPQPKLRKSGRAHTTFLVFKPGPQEDVLIPTLCWVPASASPPPDSIPQTYWRRPRKALIVAPEQLAFHMADDIPTALDSHGQLSWGDMLLQPVLAPPPPPRAPARAPASGRGARPAVPAL